MRQIHAPGAVNCIFESQTSSRSKNQGFRFRVLRLLQLQTVAGVAGAMFDSWHNHRHPHHPKPYKLTDCLVLSREWGNGLWGRLLGIIYRDYYKDPFPHSLLRTREPSILLRMLAWSRTWLWRLYNPKGSMWGLIRRMGPFGVCIIVYSL